jgi:nucleotide-binding universal stress UspA family protein
MNAPDNEPILCGTDFSEGATHAANAAAALARRFNAPLLLVHSVDERGEFPENLHARFIEERRPKLAAEAARVRGLGISVEEKVLGGLPRDGIAQCAASAKARMVIVASSGTGTVGRWMLGSVAERTAESSPAPTLVVRSSAPFEAWARGERALKVFIGVDFTASADAALRWVAALRRFGPCEVVAAYADWPPEERARMGLAQPSPLVGNAPTVQQILERDLRDKAAGILGDENVRIRVCGAWGRADATLVELAIEEQADLIVIGTHQWHGMSRLRHGSVSRAILHHAPMSVACVPVPAPASTAAEPIRECRRVLASVDLGASHGFAAPHAYSIVHPGGTVRLLHVLAPQRSQIPPVGSQSEHIETLDEHRERIAHAEARLRALAPPDAQARGITTEVEIAEEINSASAICHAAERFNADVVCVGAHTRPGMAAKVLGSVSLGVLQQCRRPVLLVWPPRV